NYSRAGGCAAFSNYFTPQYDNAVLHSSLKKNIVFAQHNLVTDSSFNEFHLIICRNVLVFFNSSLQDRVHKLLYESLSLPGYLALGRRDNLDLSPYKPYYELIDGQNKFYRKIH